METTATQDSFFTDIYESSGEVKYAGFWIRFAAILIDGIALMVPNGLLYFAFLGSFLLNPNAIETDPTLFLSNFITYMIASFLLQILYKAIMESSAWQATLGKRALDLKVTDEEGQRISFLRGLGRAFASVISYMIMLIGYIMAAFSSRKQALHDKIAGTLVVKTR